MFDQPMGVCMERGSFRVERLDKGFEIMVYEANTGEVYREPKKGVAASEAEVTGFFTKWLGSKDGSFSFEDGK